uniref:Transmembrane 9 superfamily member n=1 Tax=Macrostomum lignano TaxID=282301 RepID=A0A1I8JKR5_9PLAT
MGIFCYYYLPDNVIRGFDSYKYSSQDTSPFANYVMHPFWNWLVKFLPRKLAPNLMTLSGFLCLVLNCLLLAYFDPDLRASSADFPEYRQAMWLVSALLNFASHTLDGMDGKQARRTGTSSPVGEMFDHGLDSWATLFFPMCVYSVFGRGVYGGHEVRVYYLYLAIMGQFVLSHWEKYVTGMFFLPWAYDLSQVSLVSVYAFTFAVGDSFWQTFAFGTWTYTDLVILSCYIGFWILCVPLTLYNVYSAYANKTGRHNTLSAAMTPLLSPAILLVFSALWVHFSPNQIIFHYPRLFYAAFGTVFSNITCRLIVSQMSSTKCQAFNLLTAIYSAVSLAVFLLSPTFQQELAVLIGLLAVCVLLHVHYGCNVVNQMLDHFKLRAFVIESPQKKSNAVKVRTAPGIAAPSLLQAAMTQVAMKPFHSLLLLCCAAALLRAAGGAELYKQGGPVQVYVNKVGPYFNPHETYHYYQLPVCRPATIVHKSMSLGELLDGDRMAQSMFDIRFGQDAADKVLCSKQLSAADLEQLRTAVEDLYYFEFVVDDIPVRGFVGHLEETGFVPHSHKVFLWTHFSFRFYFSGQRIVFVKVVTQEKAPVDLAKLQPGSQVAFTYSVAWVKSDVKFEDRAKLIKDTSFFPKTLEIHWLSVINSLILVLLLIGFVTVILFRILKKDFARYNLEDEEADEDSDNGWKTVHNDVFRPPKHKCFFSATIGVGAQFLAIITGLFVMALLGLFNVHHHGNINSAGIVLYAFTSGIAGFVSCRMFRRLGGERWARNVLLTSFLFAFPLFMVWAVVNSVAWAYGTTQALP